MHPIFNDSDLTCHSVPRYDDIGTSPNHGIHRAQDQRPRICSVSEGIANGCKFHGITYRSEQAVRQ